MSVKVLLRINNNQEHKIWSTFNYAIHSDMEQTTNYDSST